MVPLAPEQDPVRTGAVLALRQLPDPLARGVEYCVRERRRGGWCAWLAHAADAAAALQYLDLNPGRLTQAQYFILVEVVLFHRPCRA